MTPRRLLVFVATLLLAFVRPALAQPADYTERGERDEHGPRVILFEHAGFRGGTLVVYPGDVIENLSGLKFDNGRSVNDEISSIRIEGPVVITVYEHAGFRGEMMRLGESVRDLSGRAFPGGGFVTWNDRISSLRVELVRPHHEGGEGRRADPDLIIRRSFQDVLLRDPREADFRQYRSYILDQGWTEQMVRDQLRHSEEFRHEGVDRLVRRVYLEILGREPDPGGLATFRRMILEKDWTENDLRDALRKSEEFKRKHK